MDGSTTNLATFITSITGAMSDFSTANLGQVLVAAIGITAGLALSWFAYRWLVRRIMSAFRGGAV